MYRNDCDRPRKSLLQPKDDEGRKSSGGPNVIEAAPERVRSSLAGLPSLGCQKLNGQL